MTPPVQECGDNTECTCEIVVVLRHGVLPLFAAMVCIREIQVSRWPLRFAFYGRSIAYLHFAMDLHLYFAALCTFSKMMAWDPFHITIDNSLLDEVR